MTVFMFPGQGSQVKGMGEDLFEEHQSLCDIATSVLGYDIKKLCLENSNNLLSNTQYTQPALFFVEALNFIDRNQQGITAEYSIGHSLGEYSALFSANVFDLETGLKLVKRRGELMAQAQNGGMLAVIDLPETRINELLSEHNLNSVCIANKNSPRQYVLSGPKEDIDTANNILSKEALMCVPLNVSGAFHSNYMSDAKDEFSEFINEFNFKEPTAKVVANLNVELYSLNNIKDNLVHQINSPVRWSETIAYLKQQGETEFIEVGPGNVLTRLLSQN